MSDKIYCGRGKRFGKYGTIMLNICLDDIPDDFKKENDKNGKTYLRLNLDEKREVDNYGYTHNISVDTWKPNEAPAPAPRQSPVKQAEAWDKGNDDLPF